MESFFGYFASGLIGVSLGLIGGGGSIITIPILVYLFHIEPTLATAYSLIIVGFTSLVGGTRNAFHKMVDFKIALLFSLPSLVSIYFTRHYLLPHVPSTILTVGGFGITKDLVIMIFFSIIMVVASIKMIRGSQLQEVENSPVSYHLMKITVQGILLGIVTGIIGAGGGFLIIPALVLMAGLSMKKAIGTSLIIITLNSFVGFLGDLGTSQLMDYPFIASLTALATVGIFLGIYLAKFFNGNKLKAGFGWFALAMAVFIFGKELFFN